MNINQTLGPKKTEIGAVARYMASIGGFRRHSFLSDSRRMSNIYDGVCHVKKDAILKSEYTCHGTYCDFSKALYHVSTNSTLKTHDLDKLSETIITNMSENTKEYNSASVDGFAITYGSVPIVYLQNTAFAHLHPMDVVEFQIDVLKDNILLGLTKNEDPWPPYQ